MGADFKEKETTVREGLVVGETWNKVSQGQIANRWQMWVESQMARA